MENTLYLALLFFAFTLTLLSFIKNKTIALRLFSAMALIAAAIAGLGEPFLYVGFGSVNVITYASSQAGDPGRTLEPWVCLMYGLMGFVQLLITVYLAIDYGQRAAMNQNVPEVEV